MGRGDSPGAGARAQLHYEIRYGKHKYYLSRRRGATAQSIVEPEPDFLKKQQENYNKTCGK